MYLGKPRVARVLVATVASLALWTSAALAEEAPDEDRGVALVPALPMIGAPAGFSVSPTSCLARERPAGCPALDGIGLLLPTAPATTADARRVLADTVRYLTAASAGRSCGLRVCDVDDLLELIDEVIGGPVCEGGVKECADDVVEAVEEIGDGTLCRGERVYEIDALCTVGNVERLVTTLVDCPSCPSAEDVVGGLLALATAFAPEDGWQGAYLDLSVPVGSHVDFNKDDPTSERNGHCNFSAHEVKPEPANGSANKKLYTESWQSCGFAAVHHGIDVYLQRWQKSVTGSYWATMDSGHDQGFSAGPNHPADYVRVTYDCHHQRTYSYRNETYSWREQGGGNVVVKTAASPKTPYVCWP